MSDSRRQTSSLSPFFSLLSLEKRKDGFYGSRQNVLCLVSFVVGRFYGAPHVSIIGPERPTVRCASSDDCGSNASQLTLFRFHFGEAVIRTGFSTHAGVCVGGSGGGNLVYTTLWSIGSRLEDAGQVNDEITILGLARKWIPIK